MLKVYSGQLDFDPSDVLEGEWRKKLSDAQDASGIHFDTENDEAKGNIKRIAFPPEAEHYDSKSFYVEMRAAGGDWEMPTTYFRIQVKEGYPSRHMLCFIPGAEQGNSNLQKVKKGWKPYDGDDPDHDDDTRDEKQCWDAVENYLKDWKKVI